MKKLLVTLVVLAAVSMFPLAAYANNGHHHGWDRKAQHERIWREHEREWAEHDREWREHQYDVHWRKVHAEKWHEWYKWHETDENEFHLRISGENFVLDING